MSEYINAGFPPLKLEIIKKSTSTNKKESNNRFYAPTNLNIFKILNTTKKDTMIQKKEIIDTIESF